MRSSSMTSSVFICVNKILPLRELDWTSVHLVCWSAFQHRLVHAIYYLRHRAGIIQAIARSREVWGKQYRRGFSLFWKEKGLARRILTVCVVWPKGHRRVPSCLAFHNRMYLKGHCLCNLKLD